MLHVNLRKIGHRSPLSVDFTGLFRFIITIINKLINETRKSEFVSGGSLDPLGGVGK